MNVCAILMCGGKQTRMEGFSGPKQLVPVNGEPVADRTVRLLREKCERALVTVVAPPTNDWLAFSSRAAAAQTGVTSPHFLEAIRDQIFSIAPSLKIDKVLVLNGDVIFSPDLLERLLFDTAEVAFAGRFVPNIHTGRPAGELYGFAYQAKMTVRSMLHSHVNAALANLERMRTDVVAATDDQVSIARIMEANLRLWHLMHKLEDEWQGSFNIVETDWWDYSDDIDGPDDLERLPRIEAAIRRREIQP